MLHLKKWCLHQCIGGFYATGEAYGHYRFENGKAITTSNIVHVNSYDSQYVLETYSGSMYIVSLEDVIQEYKEPSEQLLKSRVVKKDIAQRLQKFNKGFQDRKERRDSLMANLEQRLLDEFKPGTLYLAMDGMRVLKPFLEMKIQPNYWKTTHILECSRIQ